MHRLGCSPLATAISKEYVYMIDKLLIDMSDTIDVNTADSSGDTPLIKAIWSAASASETLMSREESVRVVRRLVELGADVNARNETGRTALFVAVYENLTDMALLLLDAGASCQLSHTDTNNNNNNNTNFTLIHYACLQGNYTVTKKLLEHKCDPNSTAAGSCESLVYSAVTKGYLDIVALLIAYGADVNFTVGSAIDNKCTALQAAVYYLRDYELFKAMVDTLVAGHADLNIALPGPIVFICLQYNKSAFGKYLIGVGASVHQRTLFNQSAFYRAFLNKNLDFMHMCVMAGFRVSDELWVPSYLDNPDFIEYADFYVRQRGATAAASAASEATRRRSVHEDEDEDEVDDEQATVEELQRKTDQELADMLNRDEYFMERFHRTRPRRQHANAPNEIQQQSDNSDTAAVCQVSRKIYKLIKFYHTNPLSLKELARIQIRRTLLAVDFKIKVKIERHLDLPAHLKDYLLLKEFNL